MDFLQRFTEPERERLLSVAQTVQLARGQRLLRRGEPGGDLYRVVEGELEVVDTRTQPVIVLQVLRAGALVGEMAFLDESPRSADVRAADGAVCQRWERRALHALLQSDPTLGARFYEIVARMLSDRVRDLTVLAAPGARLDFERGSDHAAAAGRALGDSLRARFMDAEPMIRRDPVRARAEVHAALDALRVDIAEAQARMSAPDADELGQAVARELHPYLMRSQLGELAIARANGRTGDAATLAHLLNGVALGDGPLGEFIDDYLLALPTARALRARREAALDAVRAAIPADGPCRVLVLNADACSILTDLSELLPPNGVDLTCVDGSAEALAAVDRRLPGQQLRLKLVCEDTAAVCLGQAQSRFPPQDLVVVDGVFEYLPRRLAMALLGWVGDQLAPTGSLVATGVADSDDEAVFRHLLGWPMVRRSAAGMNRLLHGAGYVDATVWTPSGGLVCAARYPGAVAGG